MSNPILARQFQKALTLWPKDPLRPHANFAEVMQKRLKTPTPTTTTQPTGAQSTKGEPSESQTNALFTLLENRYAKKYVLSESTWKPASNPNYYESLIQEMNEAPKRSWLSRYLNSWKGFVRWK